jgi:hypothetical protein
METYLKKMVEKEEEELNDALATFEEIAGARMQVDSGCVAAKNVYSLILGRISHGDKWLPLPLRPGQCDRCG